MARESCLPLLDMRHSYQDEGSKKREPDAVHKACIYIILLSLEVQALLPRHRGAQGHVSRTEASYVGGHRIQRVPLQPVGHHRLERAQEAAVHLPSTRPSTLHGILCHGLSNTHLHPAASSVGY